MLTLVAPTFAQQPAVEGPPSPLPPAVPIELSILVILLVLVSLVWWLSRRRVRAESGRLARIGVFGVAIGNALLEMAAFFQPDRPRVELIERLREERPSDAVGDDREPPGADPGTLPFGSFQVRGPGPRGSKRRRRKVP
jgi:hypothetical protein